MAKPSKERNYSFSGYRLPQSVTNEAIELYLTALDCPRALTVWLLYINGEHEQLTQLGCQVSDYGSTPQFRDAYAATCFLSKYPYLKGHEKEARVKRAMEKFELAETSCAAVNRGMSVPAVGTKYPQRDAHLVGVRRKIERLLGGNPVTQLYTTTFDPVEWFESCSWGPGATFSQRGSDVHPIAKFQREVGITKDLYDLVAPLLPEFSPIWWEHLRDRIAFVPGNEVTTVPKNAEIERDIAIEPGLNVFFQLGIGRMISRRLRRFGGIDLNTQERNGLLAFYASMTDKLVTGDFSMASGMISSRFVEEVLPRDWYLVMDACRSKFGLVGGVWRHWEKFSSMGNGFTFPLQSLIFTACALESCEIVGVSDEYVGVFGDDVIIPKEAWPTFVEMVSSFGFLVNQKKSFASGPFRESCGTHYHNGVDVKPFYLRERLTSVRALYRFANGVRDLAHRHNIGFGCSASFKKCWLFVVHKVPKKFRLFVSRELGDQGIWSNFDEAAPSIKRCRNGWEGFRVRCYGTRPRTVHHDGKGVLLYALHKSQYGKPDESGQDASSQAAYLNDVPLRGRTVPILHTVTVQRWYDLGQWI